MNFKNGYDLTLSCYPKLHIAAAPSNFSSITCFPFKMVTVVDFCAFVGHKLNSHSLKMGTIKI